MKIDEIVSIINEAPIQDFKTIGDFDRNSSFRDPKDRAMLTNPKAQEIYKKKFSNTEYDFNMYFVNSPAAGRHTEVGQVDINWVKENLGDEVAKAVKTDSDAINIIFTNNKGDQRVNMTPWIMAHRLSHVFTRPNVKGGYIQDAFGEFMKVLSAEVFPLYGIRNFPTNWSRFMGDAKAQKTLQLFMYAAGTFKSARDKKLRNGVEALHELFAQFIISGEVKSNGLPKSFGNRNASYRLQGDIRDFEMVEYEHYLANAFDSINWGMDQALGAYVNSIFVM